jgi:hypothetical protein
MEILSRNSYLELSILPDCAGLSETGKCYWLNISKCQGKNCSFRNTRDELAASLAYTKMRLAALSEKEQVLIANKYYGGTMPWAQT